VLQISQALPLYFGSERAGKFFLLLDLFLTSLFTARAYKKFAVRRDLVRQCHLPENRGLMETSVFCQAAQRIQLLLPGQGWRRG